MSAEPAADDPVLFIDDMAKLLGTSVRTIQRQIRAGTFFIPELPKVDHKHRWSRVRVLQAIADETQTTHAARVTRDAGARRRHFPHAR